MIIRPDLIDFTAGADSWELGHTSDAVTAGLREHTPEDRTTRGNAKAGGNVRLDYPCNVGRAVTLLKGNVERGHIAVQNKRGDELTYSLCCEIMSLGLSPDKAQEIIEQYWNPACVPPWSSEELRVKIDNAIAYAQNEPGAFAAPAVQDMLSKEALDKLLADSMTPEPEIVGGAPGVWSFGLHDPVTDADLQPVTYRDRNRLWPDSPGKTITQVIAGPKEHKTNWIMAELFRLAIAGIRHER